MKPRSRYTDGGADTPDAIRTEIAHTRDLMDHTLDAIGERLTPRHLLDEALDFFSKHRPDPEGMKAKAGAAAQKAGDITSHVGRLIANTVRDHPASTLLIVAGIGMAVLEARRGQANEEMAEGSETAGAEFESAGGDMQGTPSAARERLREKQKQIQMKATEFKRRAGQSAQRAYTKSRDTIRQITEAEPCAVGLACAALGVLAGLALPHSGPEDRWFGESSDRIKSRTKAKGQEFVSSVKHVATTAVNAGKEEAAKQGFASQEGYEAQDSPEQQGSA